GFLNLGRIARTRAVPAESQAFAESVGLYNNEERFQAIDADQNGRLSVNEAARLASSSIDVSTGQTDRALNFFSKVGDQLTGTDREEGVFSIDDVRFVQEAFEGGQSVEQVERALLERLNGGAEPTGSGVTPPLP